MRTLDSGRDDDVDILAAAHVVVGVGAGVDPARYPEVEALAACARRDDGGDAEVTDKERMPRACKSASPVAASSRSCTSPSASRVASTTQSGFALACYLVAVNNDSTAPIFEACDLGIVADWADVVPLVMGRLAALTVAR